MRMSRHLATYGVGEKFTFYDYIQMYSTSSSSTKSNSIGIRTPVFDTDVMIRSTIMPICADSTRDSQYLIVSKAFDASDVRLYGSGLRAAYYNSSHTKGILYIKTTNTEDLETGVAAWMDPDEWYQMETRLSLNAITGQSNYIRIGTHQLSLAAGSGKSDFTDPWFLFGLNGLSNYWNEYSSSVRYGACALQETYFYDYTGTNLIADLKPCKRESDNAPGMLDVVSGVFCPLLENESVISPSNGWVGNLS